MPHLPLWYLGEVSKEECDKAFSEFMTIPPKDATMGVAGETKDHLTRSTTVRFAPYDHWFGKIMLNFGHLANQACNWEYSVNGHEAVQFAEYGVGQKYHWHVDNFPLSGNPVERKVTVVCLMSEPSEYEGGQLQLRLYQEYTPELKKGSIIAFPAIIEHQVLPVIKGVRHSAAMWINGPRFR